MSIHRYDVLVFYTNLFLTNGNFNTGSSDLRYSSVVGEFLKRNWNLKQ